MFPGAELVKALADLHKDTQYALAALGDGNLTRGISAQTMNDTAKHQAAFDQARRNLFTVATTIEPRIYELIEQRLVASIGTGPSTL